MNSCKCKLLWVWGHCNTIYYYECDFLTVLPELPLPTPLQNALNNKSLLYSLKLSEKSRKLLDDADDALVEQISTLLRQASTEKM